MRWGKVAVGMGLAAASGTVLAQTDPLAPLAPPVVIHRTPAPSFPLNPRPVLVVPYVAQPALTGFAGYKQTLIARARREGVSEATIAANIPGLVLNQRVVTLDRDQPGGIYNPNAYPPFAPYRRAHVSADLIRRGQQRYSSNYTRLMAIEQRYGVQASVLLAIFGHETSYGTVTGSFDLLPALATLAYEGRRRELFESEFVAALKLIDRGTPRSRLKGSWAGATGYPQFMPSAVLRLAVDGDGDGYSNIWASESDGLASIANFLRDAGWKPGVHWGIPVRVPYGFNRAAVASNPAPSKCTRVYQRHSQYRTLRQWRAMGITPAGSWRGIGEDEPVSLIEPDGANATAYLISANYRAILGYNCSNFYALSVGLLADAIVGR